MRIATWDELPSVLDLQRYSVQLGAFSGVFDRRTVRLYRRWHAFSEYVGLFALEDGRVAGQLFVLRLPFRTASGVEEVSGICAVTTRADLGHRGIAAQLLQEAHRREAAAGRRFALLWTNRSWFAHRLYESLGYRDVYVPPLAARLVRRTARAPPAGTLRAARPGDLEKLEALHAEFAADGLGFAPRPPGFLRLAREAGDLDLSSLLVYRRGGPRTGYAVIARRPRELHSGELVASPAGLPGLVRALEHRIAPGLIVLHSSPVRALEEELLRSGYLVRHDEQWYVLMACPLGGSFPGPALRRELGSDQRSFACQSLDRF